MQMDSPGARPDAYKLHPWAGVADSFGPQSSSHGNSQGVSAAGQQASAAKKPLQAVRTCDNLDQSAELLVWQPSSQPAQIQFNQVPAGPVDGAVSSPASIENVDLKQQKALLSQQNIPLASTSSVETATSVTTQQHGHMHQHQDLQQQVCSLRRIEALTQCAPQGQPPHSANASASVQIQSLGSEPGCSDDKADLAEPTTMQHRLQALLHSSTAAATLSQSLIPSLPGAAANGTKANGISADRVADDVSADKSHDEVFAAKTFDGVSAQEFDLQTFRVAQTQSAQVELSKLEAFSTSAQSDTAEAIVQPDPESADVVHASAQPLGRQISTSCSDRLTCKVYLPPESSPEPKLRPDSNLCQSPLSGNAVDLFCMVPEQSSQDIASPSWAVHCTDNESVPADVATAIDAGRLRACSPASCGIGQSVDTSPAAMSMITPEPAALCANTHLLQHNNDFSQEPHRTSKAVGLPSPNAWQLGASDDDSPVTQSTRRLSAGTERRVYVSEQLRQMFHALPALMSEQRMQVSQAPKSNI